MQTQPRDTPTPTLDSSRPFTELEANVARLKSELSALMINRDAMRQEVEYNRS